MFEVEKPARHSACIPNLIRGFSDGWFDALPAIVLVLASRLFRGIPNLIRGFSEGWFDIQYSSFI